MKEKIKDEVNLRRALSKEKKDQSSVIQPSIGIYRHIY